MVRKSGPAICSVKVGERITKTMRDRRALRFFLVCMLFLPAVGTGFSAPASNKSTDSSPLSGKSPENSIANFSLSTSLGRVVLNAGLQSKLAVTVKRSAGFSSASELTVVGLPPEVVAQKRVTKSGFLLLFQAPKSMRKLSAAIGIVVTAGQLTRGRSIVLQVNNRNADAQLTNSSTNESFQLGVDPPNSSPIAGGESRHVIAVKREKGPAGPVRFSATALPAGVKVVFFPESSSYATVMVLKTASSTLPGTATVQITGTDGGSTGAAEISLNVRSERVSVAEGNPSAALAPSSLANPQTSSSASNTDQPEISTDAKRLGGKPSEATTGPRGALSAMVGGDLVGDYSKVHITGDIVPTGPLRLTDCRIDGNISIYEFPITLDHCLVKGYIGLVTDNTNPKRSMFTARFTRFIGPADNDAMHLGAYVWNDNSKYINTLIEDSIIYSPYQPTPGDHADVIQFGGGRNSMFRRVLISMRDQPFDSSLTNYINNGTQNSGVVFESLWIEGGPMGFVLGGPMTVNNCILARSTAHYGYIYPDGDRDPSNDPKLSKCYDDLGATIPS